MVRYRRRSPDEVGQSSHAGPWLSDHLVGGAFFIMLAMFAWGARLFFVQSAAAGAAEYWATGKQWMWEVRYPGRHPRDQSPARADRPDGEADHDLRGRHPQPACRPSASAGRQPRRLHGGLVPPRARRHLPSLLRSVLRRRALAHGGQHRRHAAGRPPAAWLAGGPPNTASPAAAGAQLFPDPGLLHLPRVRSRLGGASQPSRVSSAATVPLEGGGTIQADEAPARVDPPAGGEGRQGLAADHADLPGPGSARSS